MLAPTLVKFINFCKCECFIGSLSSNLHIFWEWYVTNNVKLRPIILLIFNNTFVGCTPAIVQLLFVTVCLFLTDTQLNQRLWGRSCYLEDLTLLFFPLVFPFFFLILYTFSTTICFLFLFATAVARPLRRPNALVVFSSFPSLICFQQYHSHHQQYRRSWGFCTTSVSVTCTTTSPS